MKTKYNLDFWFLSQTRRFDKREFTFFHGNCQWKVKNNLPFQSRHTFSNSSQIPPLPTVLWFIHFHQFIPAWFLWYWVYPYMLIASKAHLYPNYGGILGPSFPVLFFFNWIITEDPCLARVGTVVQIDTVFTGRLTWKCWDTELWMLRYQGYAKVQMYFDLIQTNKNVKNYRKKKMWIYLCLGYLYESPFIFTCLLMT